MRGPAAWLLGLAACPLLSVVCLSKVYLLRPSVADTSRGTLLCSADELCEADLAWVNWTAAIHRQLQIIGAFAEDDVLRDFAAEQNGVTRRRFQWRVGMGQAPLVIHVGANDLQNKDEIQEYEAYSRWAASLVLVEPNPALVPALKARVEGLRAAPWHDPRVGDSRAAIVNAAVCPTDGENVSFFRFARRIIDDLNIPPEKAASAEHSTKNLLHRGSSLNRTVLVQNGQTSPLRPFLREPLESYVEEEMVSCKAPQTILKELSLVPEAVDVLNVDAEGLDTVIVNTFLNLPAFSPAVIRFEWMEHVDEQLSDLISTLALRGYEVHAVGFDIIALIRRERNVSTPPRP